MNAKSPLAMSRQAVAHCQIRIALDRDRRCRRHEVFTRSQCHCGRSNTVTLLRERKLGEVGPSFVGLVYKIGTGVCQFVAELGESS